MSKVVDPVLKEDELDILQGNTRCNEQVEEFINISHVIFHRRGEYDEIIKLHKASLPVKYT